MTLCDPRVLHLISCSLFALLYNSLSDHILPQVYIQSFKSSIKQKA